MSVGLSLSFKPNVTYNSTIDGGTKSATYDAATFARTLAEGVGMNQCDKIFWKTYSVPFGTPVDIDLAGSLSDLLSGTLTLAKLKLLMIFNQASEGAPTNILNVGGGSNPITTLWGAGGDIIKVKPQGCLLLFDPTAGGYAVTAGTGDILRLDAAAGTFNVDIMLAGTSS